MKGANVDGYAMECFTNGYSIGDSSIYGKLLFLIPDLEKYKHKTSN
jgi:hypothetical protein